MKQLFVCIKNDKSLLDDIKTLTEQKAFKLHKLNLNTITNK